MITNLLKLSFYLVVLFFINSSFGLKAQQSSDSLRVLKDKGESYFSFKYSNNQGKEYKNQYRFYDKYFVRILDNYSADVTFHYKIFYKDILYTDGKPKEVRQDTKNSDYKVAVINIQKLYMCQTADCDSGGKFWESPGSRHGFTFHKKYENEVMNLMPHIMALAKENGAKRYNK